MFGVSLSPYLSKRKCSSFRPPFLTGHDRVTRTVVLPGPKRDRRQESHTEDMSPSTDDLKVGDIGRRLVVFFGQIEGHSPDDPSGY